MTGGPAIVADINQLPMAAHHLFEGSYHYFATVREPYTSMITSRGCPFNCRFCGKLPGTRKVRLRTADKVLEEMLRAVSLGYREIYFYDDLFTVNRQRVFDLSDSIRKHGLDLPWSVRARVDTVDEELLARMKAAGCRRLYFGVESGSERTLKLMDKRISTAQAMSAVQACRRIGLETVSYFILGFPGETEADMAETVRFACELPTDFASFNIFCPLPASPVHDQLCSEGLDPWVDYIHLRSDKLPSYKGDLDAETVERYFRECWKRFYGRPQAWAALARMIDSPHRAKSFAFTALSVAVSKVLTSRLEVSS
jgi:anaerobic magnesium-protoporphyrin IX monomethyl ester cyclase